MTKSTEDSKMTNTCEGMKDAGNEKEMKKTREKEEKKQKEESTDSEVSELKKNLDELKEKLSREKDDYLRLMAEFDNYRRRTSQEKLDLVNTASRDTISGLLPILDDFERAIAALKDTSDSDSAKEGTELIYGKLMGFLKGKGLSVIEACGKDFDTDFHEAIAQLPASEENLKGKVLEVVQTGYMLNGTVIRFAKVVVGI